MSNLRELEAQVLRRRASVSEEEQAMRKLTAEMREVAAATQRAERNIRSLERRAAVRGGVAWGKDATANRDGTGTRDGAATRAGGATRADGAGMGGGAAGGDAAPKTAAGSANAAMSSGAGSCDTEGSTAAGALLPGRATALEGAAGDPGACNTGGVTAARGDTGGSTVAGAGGRREPPVQQPATSNEGGECGENGGEKGRPSVIAGLPAREVPPDTAAPIIVDSDSTAQRSAARTVGGAAAPAGTGASPPKVKTSGNSPPPRAPADGSSMSELERYQLLMKKWKHRLDTEGSSEAGNEAGNEAGERAGREAAEPNGGIDGAGDSGTSRA